MRDNLEKNQFYHGTLFPIKKICLKYVKYSFARIKKYKLKNDCFFKALSKFFKIMEIKLLIQKKRISFDSIIFERKKMNENFNEKAFAFSKIKIYNSLKINTKKPKIIYAIEIIVTQTLFLFFLFFNKVLFLEI